MDAVRFIGCLSEAGAFPRKGFRGLFHVVVLSHKGCERYAMYVRHAAVSRHSPLMKTRERSTNHGPEPVGRLVEYSCVVEGARDASPILVTTGEEDA